MSQPNLKIDIPPDKREEKLLKAVYILMNLRKCKIKWDNNYGVENRSVMRSWEEKADKFLKEVGLNNESENER